MAILASPAQDVLPIWHKPYQTTKTALAQQSLLWAYHTKMPKEERKIHSEGLECVLLLCYPVMHPFSMGKEYVENLQAPAV